MVTRRQYEEPYVAQFEEGYFPKALVLPLEQTPKIDHCFKAFIIKTEGLHGLSMPKTREQ